MKRELSKKELKKTSGGAGDPSVLFAAGIAFQYFLRYAAFLSQNDEAGMESVKAEVDALGDQFIKTSFETLLKTA